MTLSIIPRDPARPDFAGEVQGIDLRQKLTPDEVAAVAAGMDRYAVRLFERLYIPTPWIEHRA